MKKFQLFTQTGLFILLGIAAILGFGSMYAYSTFIEKDPKEDLTSPMGLTCVDEVQISIGLSGKKRLVAEDFVQNDDDPGPYSINIVDPPIGGDSIFCYMDGWEITVQVVNMNTGLSCMPIANIRDKMPPQINCDSMEISCTVDVFEENRDLLLPGLIDNCTPEEEIQLSYSQDIENYGCSEPYIRKLTRVWTATDNNGMSSTCEQVILVERSTTDDLIFPADTTVQCGTPLTNETIGMVTLEGDSIPSTCGFVSNEVRDTFNKCGNTMIVERRFLYMGMCGSDMVRDTQTIMVIDTTPPSIICPNDQTISTNINDCFADYTIPVPNVSDDCADPDDIDLRYYVNGVIQGDRNVQLSLGENTIAIFATNPCFLEDSCSYSVIVEDRTSPTLTCSTVGISLLNNDSITYYNPDFLSDIVAIDNCDTEFDVKVQRNTAGCGIPANGPFSDTLTICCSDIDKTIMATFMVTDNAGNTAMCMVEVDVMDTDAPDLVCPADSTIQCSALEADLGAYGTVSVEENCGFVVDSTEVYDIDPCGEGTITRTFTVTDNSGNISTCEQILTIENDEIFDAQSITYPEDVTITQCDPDLSNLDLTGEVTFNEPVCLEISVEYTDEILNNTEDEACKEILRTFIVTNECNEDEFSDTQIITVKNNAAPELMVSADITAYTDPTNCFVNINLPNALISDCTTGGTIENNITNGGASVKADFFTGKTNVIYTATDTCGNMSVDTTMVTVLDTISPTIECPTSPIEVNNDPGECEAFVDVPVPSVMDNCDSMDLTITNDRTGTEDASGIYMVGETTVIFTVTDSTGNSDTCSVTIIVNDMEGPEIIECASDTSIIVDGNCSYIVPDFTEDIVFNDNCDGMSGMITVTQDLPAGISQVGDTSVVITVSDLNDNTSTCVVNITAEDTISPEITTVPENDTIEVDADCEINVSDYTGDYTAIDNCDDPVITQLPLAGTVISDAAGTSQEILIIATDDSGNADTVSFELFIEDNIAPEITCPADITVSANADCEADVTVPVPAVSDNCDSDPTITNDRTAGEDASGIYPVGTTTVIFTVEDNFGNTDTCSVDITVQDTTAPVFVECPPAMDTLLAGEDCIVEVPDYESLTEYGDNCSDSTENVTFTQSIPAGNEITGDTLIELIITDGAGNMDTCEFTIVINDTMAPEITTVPENDTIEVDADCEINVPDYTGDYTAIDNCDDPVITQLPLAGTVISDAAGTSQEILIIATDDSGNADTVSFDLLIEDNIAPEITCPADITVSANADCEADVTVPVPTVSDNCDSDPTITNDRTAGEDASGNYPVGTTTVIFTVEDNFGNTDTCSVDITVQDTTAPVFVECPPAMDTLLAGEDCIVEVPDYESLTEYGDNCSDSTENVTFTQSIPAGNEITGDTLIELIITDGAGNMDTCEFTIVINDTMAPEITTVPENDTIEVDADCEVSVPDYTGDYTAIDNCDDPVITQIPLAGTVISDAAGTSQEILIIATDDSGNADTVSFELFIEDNIAPEITCPADITVSANADCEADVTVPVPAVSDNCDSDPTITNDRTAGEDASGIYPVGTTTVIFTVEDNFGNTDTCSVEITVQDTTAPVFVECPPAMDTLLAGEDCIVEVPDYESLTEYGDNCSDSTENVTFTQSIPAGNEITGDTLIELIITDGAGNMDTCEFTLIVDDNMPPEIITAPIDITVAADVNCEYVLEDFAGVYNATDNCDADPTITQEPGIGTVYLDSTGTTQEIFIIATDESGNADTVSFDLTIEDNIAPVISCPADITVVADEDCEADVTIPLPTVIDNCDIDPTITNNQNGGSNASGIYPIGDTEVIFIAEDNFGNMDTCSMIVTVEDRSAPVFVECPPAMDTLPAGEDCIVEVPDYESLTEYGDNCSDSTENVTFTQSIPAGTEITGDTLIELIITDGAGNMDTCEFTIVVSDTMTPVIVTVPENDTVEVDENCEVILGDYTVDYEARDNCGDPTITQFPEETTVLVDSAGTVQEIIIIATDDSGNADTVSFELIIEDNIAPTITCPADITVSANADCEADVTVPVPTVSDNCDSDPTITNDRTAGEDASGIYPVGTTTVIFTVEDNFGNTDTCSVDITVQDTTAPVFVECPDLDSIFVNEDCEGIVPDYSLELSYSDNCSDSTENLQFSQSIPAGTLISSDTTIEITVTDNSGNTGVCEFALEIVDTIAPIVFAENSYDVFLEGSCSYTYGNFADSLFILDNCDSNPLIITQDPVEGTIISGPGNTSDSVTITVEDFSGNIEIVEFIINLNDTIPPMIVCPSDTVVGCDTDFSTFEDADISDACGIDTTYEVMTSITNQCGPDTITRKIYAIDSSGNIDSCSQVIIIGDNFSPLSEDDFEMDSLYFTSCQNFRDTVPPALTSGNCRTYSIELVSDTSGIDSSFCRSFLRTWLVVDSCTESAPPFDSFEVEQYIFVTDTMPPVPIIPSEAVITAPENTCEVFIDLGAAGGSDCIGIESITNDSPFADENGSEADGTYPIGTHDFTYTITDSCGNSSTATQNVTVLPDLGCITGDSIQLFPEIIFVTADDRITFDTSVCDNSEDYGYSFSSTDINDTIREYNCDSTGMPGFIDVVETVYFYYQGEVLDSCTTSFTVFEEDPEAFCSSNDSLVALNGNVIHWMGEMMNSVDVELEGINITQTNNTGGYQFEEGENGYSYNIMADLDDDPLNGLSTYDLYEIYRHITQRDQIQNPYKLLAADVNMSRSITSKDMFALRKILLGIESDFEDEKSWLFVPDFINSDNIMDKMLDESGRDLRFIYTVSPYDTNYTHSNFYGVKKGDLNGSALLPNGALSPITRSISEFNYSVNNTSSGTSVTFSLQDDQTVGAMQLEIELNGARIRGVESHLPGFNNGSYHITDNNTLKIAYVSSDDLVFDAESELFTIITDARDSEVVAEFVEGSLMPELYNASGEFSVRLDRLDAGGLDYALFSNRPNPFTNETVVSFSVPHAETVQFVVFDASGKQIYEKQIEAHTGVNELRLQNDKFTGKGMYYYRVKCENFTAMKKMIKLK